MLGTVPVACSVNKCYSYVSLNDTWEQSATLAHSHYDFGFSFHEQLGVVISGSKPDTGGVKKVVTTLDFQTIQVQCRKFFTEYHFI